VFALLGEATREDAPRIERVLSRGGERALEAVLARLPEASAGERARLVNVLGRLADPRAGDALRRALDDGDARVVRRAASALGKLDFSEENDAALRAAWARADTLQKRPLAEALGKVGGPAARALLEQSSTDPELSRILKKALLLLDRRHSRDAPRGIRTNVRLGVTLPLLAACRAGISTLLADELSALGPARVVSPSLVELPFAGSVDELFVARTALEFGVRVELPDGDPDLALAVATALASPAAQATLTAWSEGAPRYRVSFAGGGHQRALVLRIALAVSSALPSLVNDSRDASFEVVLVREDPRPHLVLVPRAYEDPRFSYRKRDVRAASHPTLAAALARTAGARPTDVVWDPFVGSALELVERARLGPVRKLLGSDHDPGALEAARENLAAAGVHAELREGDALRLHPENVSLILTNPPMGRRLVRDSTIGNFLDAFVAHAADVLIPGGRLVWLSPLPERTRRVAKSAGLDAGPEGPMVDLGGFSAELQTFRRGTAR
jgi:precorrin-6B methylase 2